MLLEAMSLRLSHQQLQQRLPQFCETLVSLLLIRRPKSKLESHSQNALLTHQDRVDEVTLKKTLALRQKVQATMRIGTPLTRDRG